MPWALIFQLILPSVYKIIQMQKINQQLCLLIMTLIITILISCNKKFDEPPSYMGPLIKANTSIRTLRAMHFTGDFEKIFDEMIIEGIVIANDSSGNFYKSIVIQDSSGGITIRLDGFGLYNFYPEGMKVFVKLKNLWLGDYGRMIQLGGAVDRSDPASPQLIPIPQPLFDRHIIPGSLNHTISPVTIRIDELNDTLQSCLVSITDVEMPSSDTGKPYADAINNMSLNRTLRSCSGGSAYLRSSGFASFAHVKTPRGNGSITAVYTVFRTEKQLLIRDTSDIRLNGLRCTGSGTKILFSENFENTVANTELSAPGWKNIAESGNKRYQSKMTNNNHYAEISAFATGQSSLVSWLVLPPVNLANSANEILSFITKDGFDNGGLLQVYISTNYDGGNTPWKAKWTLLKGVFSKGSVNGIGNDWIASGNISLSGFAGTVYIAFRYDGADPAVMFDKRTTTFQLDNIKIAGN